MSNNTIDYRSKCLSLFGLPEGSPDTEILSALQQQMAEWHPDKQKFSDDDSKTKATDYFKTLNELRQGLKLQKEHEKINNGIVPYSEDQSKEESNFSAIYESLDLEVKLIDAKKKAETYEDLYNYSKDTIASLKQQLKVKADTELKNKIDDIKQVYKPKKSFEIASWGTLATVIFFQTKQSKDFLSETLGINSLYTNIILIFLTLFLLGICLYKKLQLECIEELIGYFTNPRNTGYVDKGKWVTTLTNDKLHIIEEADFYFAIDFRIRKSWLLRTLFVSKKEIVLQQIADTVITDLLNKQVLSCYEVYNCNRTFKINDSDRIVRMDEGA